MGTTGRERMLVCLGSSEVLWQVTFVKAICFPISHFLHALEYKIESLYDVVELIRLSLHLFHLFELTPGSKTFFVFLNSDN